MELATKHSASSEAVRAFMTGADRIRNQYGINVEDINNDHPSSAVDRQRALLDALDDHLDGERVNTEAKSLDASQERESTPDQPEATRESEDTTRPENTAQEQGAPREQDAAQDKGNETGHLGQAEQLEGETNRDQKNTETAEAKEVITAQKSEAGTRDSTNVPLNQHSDACQRVLQVWREKSGGARNPSIAQVPTLE